MKLSSGDSKEDRAVAVCEVCSINCKFDIASSSFPFAHRLIDSSQTHQASRNSQIWGKTTFTDLVLQICTISEAFLVAAARVDYEATLFVTTSVITFLQSIGLDILNLEGKKKLNIFSFSLLSSLFSSTQTCLHGIPLQRRPNDHVHNPFLEKR